MAFTEVLSGTASEAKPGMITVNTGKYSPKPDQVEVIHPDGTKRYYPWVKLAGVRIKRIFYGSKKSKIIYDNTHIGQSSTGRWSIEVELPVAPPVPPVPPLPPPVPPPPPEVPIPERTIEFWLDKGYTREQAAHITVWVKKHEMTPTPGTIDALLAELEEKPETELHKAWDEFVENPTVVGAIGAMTLSTIESFSRVFTGYSFIDDKPAEPRTGDAVAVGLIIAGLTLAAVGTIGALMPTAAAGSAATASTFPSGQAITNIMTNFGKGLAAAPTKAVALKYIATSEGIISTAIQGAPGTAVLIAKQIMAMPMKFKVLAALSGVFLLTQLDATGWFFGLSPEAGHNKAAKLLGSIRSDLIRLDDLVDDKQWEEAGKLAKTIGPQIEDVKRIMDAWPVKFWETFGFTMKDKEAMLAGLTANYNTYLNQYPQLVMVPTTFPKEFLLDDVIVEDGDTLMWPGHPEAANRIRIIGIDAHEAETAAGIEETAYLKSLIEHKQVTIKTHEYHDPEKTIDIYGRLLGGLFLGDQDIALAMLEHFGKAILTPTRYQDKYRWIDWDLYKRTAEAAVGPAVKEFKINIDSVPSNAKLYIDGTYTGHWTPANQKELKDVIYLLDPGEHVFKATKGGKEASVKATITEGVNPDIILKLGVAGLEVVEPVEVPAPPEEAEIPPVVEFKINVLSSPSRAKVHIDDIYLHHLTPMNEIELQRGPYYGIDYFTPGDHVIRVTKGGKAAEKKVTLTAGDNGEIFLSLQVVGLPRATEEIEKEIKAAEVLLEKLKAELAAL